MAVLFPDTVPAPSRALAGIACVLSGMVLFVAQDAMMKTLLQTHPIWLLIFARATMSVLILLPAIALLGGPHRLRSPLWRLHLVRAFLFAFGFTLFYAAFPFMGLAEVSTIFFSAPLITGLLAAVWLRETIGPHRTGALIAGFVGVVIAMNPFGEGFRWIAVLPLICAATYAVSQILARKIGERESSLTVGLYTLAFSGLLIVPMGGIFNRFVDAGPDFPHLGWFLPATWAGDIWLLALLGITGMAAWILTTRAYQVANASLIAPFDYSYLPLAAVLAYFLWDEVPPANTLVGMGLIVASGLYLAFRELRAARRGGDTAVVAETVFAPGNPIPAEMPEDDTRP